MKKIKERRVVSLFLMSSGINIINCMRHSDRCYRVLKDDSVIWVTFAHKLLMTASFSTKLLYPKGALPAFLF